MIRECDASDFQAIHSIINEAAQAYRGIIPEDCWHDPYMSEGHLNREMDAGVVFWGYEECGCLLGVMGLQSVDDVSLIRHAYVSPESQRRGIGRRLLDDLVSRAPGAVMVGTWADASWAIDFYEKYGFERVSREEKDYLLQKYWSIPARQVETSVVLVKRPG